MDTTTFNSKSAATQHRFHARICRKVHLILLNAFVLLAFTDVSLADASHRFVPGRILVKWKSSALDTNIVAKLNRHGAQRRDLFRNSNLGRIELLEEKADVLIRELQGNPNVEFIERDYIAEAAYVPNDPYVQSGAAWHLGRIEAFNAWNSTAGSSDVVIAVLDSGINAEHPDLAGQIVPGYDFVFGDPDPADDFGHGTAVSGVIAAAGNNGLGVAGVAHGARVMPIKVMDASGFAAYSTIAQGIRYAVDHGARIVNISIVGNAPSSTLQDAIDYAWSRNVLVVAAAGNYASNVPQYPAACDRVLAVSATGAEDGLASFSSFGNHIGIAAPGDGIWATQRLLNNPYGAWRGTSLAAPVVAGVAALVASFDPLISNTGLVSILQQSADDLGQAGPDASFGFGRVNAMRALQLAGAVPGPVPNDDPQLSDTNSPLLAVDQRSARVGFGEIQLSGRARDDAALSHVEVTVNGSVHVAIGATDWIAPITLVPGRNNVSVRSVDVAGNFSAPVHRTFVYVVNTPVTVLTNGWGRIEPDLDGAALEIGKTYTVRAVPGPGQVFAGWNGTLSASTRLRFTMQSNLVLTANFVPTPFIPVKGNYSGLMAEPGGVAPASSGYFSLAVTSLGQFSGKILSRGKRHGFQGRFDVSGGATVRVNRGELPPLTLTLNLDLTNGVDAISGLATDGSWAAEMSGDRSVFNTRTNPATQAGSRAFILERAGDLNAIAATGLSAIRSNGVTQVRGRLADGRAFTAASRISREGDYPFYLSLSRGNEVVIGWLNFPSTAGPTASGTVIWVRSGTNAFAATLTAASMR